MAVAVPLAVLVLAFFPVAATGANGTSITVTADKSGWWNAAQANPTSGTPAAGVVPVIPSSPLVPGGSLPVSASLGQPQTEAAIGIVLDGAPPGSAVHKLTMRLALAPNGGQNDSSAAIVACPITSFWGEAQNGTWADRPQADCQQASAKGVRNHDGSWTFDLTSIAARWLDQFGTLPANGVALMENADPPATFQVAFTAPPHGVAFDADIVASSVASDPFASTGSAPAPSFRGGDASLGGPTSEITPAPAAVPARPSTPRRRTPAVALGKSRAGDLGNFPVAMVLLLPLALGVALAASAALARRPGVTVPSRRQGGVGRALAARSVRRSAPELP